MVSNTVYHFMTNIQYRLKHLTAQVEAFKTGEKYRTMVTFYETWLASKDREIQKLKLELAEVRTQYIDVRNNWQEVIEDLEKEQAKELARKERANNALRRQLVKAQVIIDELKNKLLAKTKQWYQALTALEDEKGKVNHLKAQINRDYENSGIPSSMKLNRKKIANNREKTGRKPGGQPGHKGHSRKKHTPTGRIEIPVPNEFMQPRYKETGRVITKQLVDIKLNLVVTEYSTPEFKDITTGLRVHADFPEGLVNEVTYGGSIKALAFLLNNRCNVSVVKTSDLLSELTDGELRVSTGMINGLSKEFSKKTAAEQKKAFADMLLSPAIYTDFTTARVNGKNQAVIVCANDTNVIFFAKENKGHKGVEGTPVKIFQGVLIHDHDKTFYNYGGNHQECLEHIRRYLKDSMANEPKLAWNSNMRQLINEMMRFKTELDPDDNRNPNEIEPAKVAGFEAAYDEILRLAENEYDYEPPSKYYPDGFNLFKRMRDYKANHLLFLYDKNVNPTNNLSERHLRGYKRKQQQVMTFRSHDGLGFLCDSLGIIASILKQGNNLFESVSRIFMPVIV
jgi:hypothetical protein